jgi:hypothetical protein
LDAALAQIAIEVVPQAQAAVLDLDDGKIGVVRYDAVARTLASRLGRVVAQEVAEVVTLDENGRTVIRTVGMTQTEATSDPLPLNGHLTLYAMITPRLVTEALLGLQRRATATLTGMGRNTDTAGFAEVTYLNADRPGQWVTDPTSPTGQRFEATPLTLGPGYRLWLRGLDTGDGYTTPAMNVREPTPPAAFTETIAVIVDTAYREARQLHALMGSDATASGESRRQALADFEASLGPSARSVEALTRWVIETTYALALALMGRSAPADVRCTARCNLSGMLVPVEELKERREAVGAGLLARPTYQAAAGIDDPAAEDALIEAQEGDASNGDAE